MSFNSSSFISLFTFLLDIYEVKAPLLLNIQRRIGETTKPRRRIDGKFNSFENCDQPHPEFQLFVETFRGTIN